MYMAAAAAAAAAALFAVKMSSTQLEAWLDLFFDELKYVTMNYGTERAVGYLYHQVNRFKRYCDINIDLETRILLLTCIQIWDESNCE